MKNQFAIKSSMAVKSVMYSAALLFTLVCATPSFADPKEKPELKTPVEVKYLGSVDNQPVIQINISNNLAEELFVFIRDEAGNTLYTQKTKEKNFSKKFQFLDLGNDFKLIVSLVSKDDKRSQSFEINNVTREVEDVVVTEVR